MPGGKHMLGMSKNRVFGTAKVGDRDVYKRQAMNGKIIGDAAERGSVTGCKPTCGRPIWFAREPPWRHGRSALRYRGVKRVLCEYEFGWYRGRFAFRPKRLGRRAFYFN